MRETIIAIFGTVGLLIVAATLPEPHRLIGYGCGPEKLTLTAVEEDHFPPCDEIVAIAD